MHLIKVTLGYNFIFKQNGENGMCKIGLFLNGLDPWFFDVWEIMYPTFEINKKGTKIIFPDSVHARSILSFENDTWTTSLKIPILIVKEKSWIDKYKFQI